MFRLVVSGQGLPADIMGGEEWDWMTNDQVAVPRRKTTQRIKLVQASGTCLGVAAPEVRGTSCASPDTCSPGPAGATSDAVTWTNISVVGSAASRQYKVCYCVGECVSAGQYLELPGLLTVGMASLQFTASAPLLRGSAFNLALAGLMPAETQVHLTLDSHLGCAGSPSHTFMSAGSPGPWSATVSGTATTIPVAVVDSPVAVGRFLVCACGTQGCRAAAGGHAGLLVVSLAPQDRLPKVGPYSQQMWSCRAGYPCSIDVKGYLFPARYRTAQLYLAASCASTPVHSTRYVKDSPLGTKEIDGSSYLASTADTTLAFLVKLVTDVAPGGYRACLRSEAGTEEVGQVMVTARVDVGRTFELLEGNLDVSGKGLSVDHDRIAVVPADRHCGSVPAKVGLHAFPEGPTALAWAALKPSSVSSDAMLSFGPLKFGTGGGYKVCFCEHGILPAPHRHCENPEDFGLHIGDLVVSGVDCQLAYPQLREQACYPLSAGGRVCGDYFSSGPNQTTVLGPGEPPIA
mmetsp:Transcript_55329/g.125830  ORF Transcript_55329/g.125830 Transcript_55329/m.125830 type:complete len:517 (+) Transcript_55329:3-1553(+)